MGSFTASGSDDIQRHLSRGSEDNLNTHFEDEKFRVSGNA